MKLIIVDDNPLVRIGLQNVLFKSDLNADILGEAANASELLDLLSKETADLVILDIETSSRNGLDILYVLKRMYSNIPVLVLSAHSEKRFALRALKAGAFGYLNKDTVQTELVKAIRTIVEHEKRYINVEVAELLAMQLAGEIKNLPHQQLSDREYEVLSLIASGKKVTDIAERLSLSVQTIYTYLRRIKRKMNMSSNAELIRYAMRHELVV